MRCQKEKELGAPNATGLGARHRPCGWRRPWARRKMLGRRSPCGLGRLWGRCTRSVGKGQGAGACRSRAKPSSRVMSGAPWGEGWGFAPWHVRSSREPSPEVYPEPSRDDQMPRLPIRGWVRVEHLGRSVEPTDCPSGRKPILGRSLCRGPLGRAPADVASIRTARRASAAQVGGRRAVRAAGGAVLPVGGRGVPPRGRGGRCRRPLRLPRRGRGLGAGLVHGEAAVVLPPRPPRLRPGGRRRARLRLRARAGDVAEQLVAREDGVVLRPLRRGMRVLHIAAALRLRRRRLGVELSGMHPTDPPAHPTPTPHPPAHWSDVQQDRARWVAETDH